MNYESQYPETAGVSKEWIDVGNEHYAKTKDATIEFVEKLRNEGFEVYYMNAPVAICRGATLAAMSTTYIDINDPWWNKDKYMYFILQKFDDKVRVGRLNKEFMKEQEELFAKQGNEYK